MRTEIRPGGGSGLQLPAMDPSRSIDPITKRLTYVAHMGDGTARDLGAPLTSRVGLWLARWRGWRDEFNLRIGPAARRVL